MSARVATNRKSWGRLTLLWVSLNHHGVTLKTSRAQGFFSSHRAGSSVTAGRATQPPHIFPMWERQPDDYLSSSRTGCHQPVLSSFLLQPVCHCGDQPAASGTERVAQGQRSSPQVKLLHGRSSHLHARVLQFARLERCCWLYTSDTHRCDQEWGAT